MRIPSVVIAVVLGLSGVSSTARAEAVPLRARHAYAVGVRTDVLVDPSRPTPEIAGLGIAAANERRIPVTVFYPARGPASDAPVADARPARPARWRFPVIVWAQGNGKSSASTPRLVWSWAALGYVVIAPDFPASSRARFNFEAVTDWENQPGDVAFVIDEAFRGDGVAGLRGLVDPRHVGVAGHSLGAMTTLAEAFGTKADPRVDGVVSFSGVPLIGGADVASRSIPLLLVHGTDDGTIPPDRSQIMFTDARGPRALVLVSGGGHAAYLQTPDPELEQSLLAVTSRFWDATLRRGSDPTRGLADAALPGRVTVETAPAAPHAPGTSGRRPKAPR